MLKPPRVLVREVLAGCFSSGLVCHLLGKKENHHWIHPAWDSLRPFICWDSLWPFICWCFSFPVSILMMLQSWGRRNLSTEIHRELQGAHPTLCSWRKKHCLRFHCLRLKRREEHPKFPSPNVLIVGIYCRQRHKAPSSHSTGNPGSPSGNGNSQLEHQGVSNWQMWAVTQGQGVMKRSFIRVIGKANPDGCRWTGSICAAPATRKPSLPSGRHPRRCSWWFTGMRHTTRMRKTWRFSLWISKRKRAEGWGSA